MKALYEHESWHREFFSREFASQRLGRAGYWLGGAASRLALKNPVQLPAFEALLHRTTPEGERLGADLSQKAALSSAWHFTNLGNAHVTTLWALSPALIRARIRLAHNRAVQAAVSDFERNLNGSPRRDENFTPGWKLTLFAAFQSGASKEQTPKLETSLFLFNLTIERGGHAGSLALEHVESVDVHSRMKSVYKRALTQEVTWVLGHRVGLPKELTWRLQEEQPIIRADQGKTKLEAGQLFSAWQDHARHWGWGADKVSKLLMNARLDTTWRNVATDLKQAYRIGALCLRGCDHSLEKIVDRGLPESSSGRPPCGGTIKHDRDKDFGHSQ